jgi:hypothetical protein
VVQLGEVEIECSVDQRARRVGAKRDLGDQGQQISCFRTLLLWGRSRGLVEGAWRRRAFPIWWQDRTADLDSASLTCGKPSGSTLPFLSTPKRQQTEQSRHFLPTCAVPLASLKTIRTEPNSRHFKITARFLKLICCG